MTSKKFIKGDKFVVPFFKRGSQMFEKSQQTVQPYERPFSSFLGHDYIRVSAYAHCKYHLCMKRSFTQAFDELRDGKKIPTKEANSIAKWLLEKYEEEADSSELKHIVAVLKDLMEFVSPKVRDKILPELVYDEL